LALVGLNELSAREKTVFELVVRGLSNRKISEELCIADRTGQAVAIRDTVRRTELQRKRGEEDAEATRRQAMATAEAEVRCAGTGKRTRRIARLIASEKVFGQRSHAPARDERQR
jgi:Bacterial regulatory proteins, luxR family